MTNYQKRKAKNDEYRSRIKRFTLQFSLGDGEAREWFEQQPEQGTYLKGLILRDKAEQLGYREQKASPPRRAGDYEIIQSIRMGGMTMLIGYNPGDATYMTCYQDYDFLGNERFSEAIGSESYVEIMDVFLQKMRLKKKRKVLVIEEAWKAIASPLMAEYIKFMYKTARKFWASVGVVTQEIQDIIGSEIVKEAIINNSDVVMLLDQSKFKERFDNIKAILGLTETDCKKIFTINRLENKEGRSFFREVFIRRGTTSEVYGVEEPRECYMTYTTERAEKEALKLYKAELKCSHQEATEAYCRDWKRSGIEKSLPFAQMVNKAGKVLNLKEKQF